MQELSQSEGNVTKALAKYFSLRFNRTTKIQRASRKNARTFHRKTAFGQLMTYAPMWVGARFVPEIVHQRQDWIYGHDVTGLFNNG